MATLTWQDVAVPNLRTPDYTGAAEAITKGIAGLSAGVQGIASAPDQRRQAEAANALLVAQATGKFQEENTLKAEKKAEKDKKLQDEADLKAFNTVSSTLQNMTRDTALKGRPIDDVFQSEVYRNLSDGAKAHAESLLYQAYDRGLQFKEQNDDDAEGLRRWNIENARAQGADARSAAEHAARMKTIQKEQAAADLLLTGGFKSDDKKSNRLGADLINMWLRNKADVVGADMEGMKLPDVAKAAGVEDYQNAQKIFDKENAKRPENDKLPQSMLLSLVAAQAGRSGDWVGSANHISGSDFRNALAPRIRQYDIINQRLKGVNEIRDLVNQGKLKLNEDFLRVWDQGYTDIEKRKQAEIAAKEATRVSIVPTHAGNLGRPR